MSVTKSAKSAIIMFGLANIPAMAPVLGLGHNLSELWVPDKYRTALSSRFPSSLRYHGFTGGEHTSTCAVLSHDTQKS
jgi:hypothetical protein